MAWNRPNRGEVKSFPLQRKGEASSFLKRKGFRFSLGVAVVGAAVAAWILWPSDEPQTSNFKPQTSSLIKEVKPASAPIVVEMPVTNLPVMKKRDHTELSLEELKKLPSWVYTVEDRKRLDPTYAERHEHFLKEQAAIPWATHVDRELSLLLFPKDGNTGLLIPFNAKFPDRFRESLKTPTLVLADDPEELKAQKRQLNEVKAYLKAELDKGTDIVKLLNDEYRELKKVQGLQQTMRREIREYAKTAQTIDDVRDMVEAANVMLKNSGSAKTLKLPIDVSIRFENQAAEKRQEEVGK